MANLFSNPTHTAKIGYNGFDLGHVLKFSSTTGELLPVFYDILQPGDKVTCQTQIKTRTQPLQTAAMTKLTERVEWFFVPLRYLYSLFNDWYFGISDIKSSLFYSNNVKSQLPYISGTNLLSYIDSLYQGAVPDSMFTSSPVTGLRNNNTSLRIMELLGIPISQYYGHVNPTPAISENVPAVCPIFALAYQKIWYDFFRDADRIKNNPAFYNVDEYYSNPSGLDLSITDLFTCRYRPRRHDFFTYIFTSPLFGSRSTGSFGQNSNETVDLANAFQQWMASDMKLQTARSAGTTNASGNNVFPVRDELNPTQVTSGTSGVNTDSSNPSYAIYNSLSPTQIRTSFAVQKLLEITRRAGKHWDAQTLAHFGVKVPKSLSGEVEFLGTTLDSELEIFDVVSTADTSESPLGEIAGKGFNANPRDNSSVKFEAKEHGVLMALYSAEVINDYAPTGFDRLNTLMDRSAWPTPEFDNLGMQPLFNYQYRCRPESSGSSSLNSEVLGWQYRWSEFKAKYNRVTGSLSRTMKDWTTLRYMSFIGTIGNPYPVANLYCSPFDLDSILQKPYEFCDESEWPEASLFDSDPLIHMLSFDVRKASKMSTYGLESL